jgi:hypothetical protein
MKCIWCDLKYTHQSIILGFLAIKCLQTRNLTICLTIFWQNGMCFTILIVMSSLYVYDNVVFLWIQLNINIFCDILWNLYIRICIKEDDLNNDLTAMPGWRVGIAMGWTTGVRFPSGAGDFFTPQYPDRLWVLHILLSDGYRRLFPRT